MNGRRGMDDGTLGWRDAVALVVSTGVPAIVGLAAWEGLSAWLADPAYRKALWLPADLFTLAAEVLSVALLPPLALAAAGMLARGGVAIATARARLAGLAGTLAAAVF